MFYAERRKSRTSMVADLEAVGKSCVNPKLVANNTLRYTDMSGDLVYRLHNTDILTLYAAGGFTIHTRGWNTVTTRNRLNQYLPKGYGVYQYQHKQYFMSPNHPDVEYEDEVHVDAEGNIHSDMEGENG